MKGKKEVGIMLVCDECKKTSEEAPLVVRGIVYTGPPKEYIVISTLCKECDEGKPGEEAKKKIEEANPAHF